MWRCKECGGTEFIEQYMNGYKIKGILNIVVEMFK